MKKLLMIGLILGVCIITAQQAFADTENKLLGSVECQSKCKVFTEKAKGLSFECGTQDISEQRISDLAGTYLEITSQQQGILKQKNVSELEKQVDTYKTMIGDLCNNKIDNCANSDPEKVAEYILKLYLFLSACGWSP